MGGLRCLAVWAMLHSPSPEPTCPPERERTHAQPGCRVKGAGSVPVSALLEGGTHKTPAAQPLPQGHGGAAQGAGDPPSPGSLPAASGVARGEEAWTSLGRDKIGVCPSGVTSPCALLAGPGVGQAGPQPGTQPQELYIYFFFSFFSPPPPLPSFIGLAACRSHPGPRFPFLASRAAQHHT